MRIPSDASITLNDTKSIAIYYGNQMEAEMGKFLMAERLAEIELAQILNSTFKNLHILMLQLISQRGIMLMARKVAVHDKFLSTHPAEKPFTFKGEIDFVGFNVNSNTWCVIDSKFTSDSKSFSIAWAYQMLIYCVLLKKRLDVPYMPMAYVANINVSERTISFIKVNFSFLIKLVSFASQRNQYIVQTILPAQISEPPEQSNDHLLSPNNETFWFYMFALSYHSGLLDPIRSKEAYITGEFSSQIGPPTKAFNGYSFILKMRNQCILNPNDPICDHQDDQMEKIMKLVVEKKLKMLQAIPASFGTIIASYLLSVMITQNLVPVKANILAKMNDTIIKDNQLVDRLGSEDYVCDDAYETDLVCFDIFRGRFCLGYVFLTTDGLTRNHFELMDKSFLHLIWKKRLNIDYDPTVYILLYEHKMKKIQFFEKLNHTPMSFTSYQWIKTNVL